MSENRFYVYEHWRPDLDVCFYVGKGTGDRARRFKRNRAYDEVSAILADKGLCVEVRIVDGALTNHEACRLEEDRIKYWNSALPGCLTNRAGGAKGARVTSDETRLKLRLANLGRKHSIETRSKMSDWHKKNRSGGATRNGMRHSPKTIEKMKVAATGRKLSEETREKLRLSNLGKRHSPETREKMSASQRARLAKVEV